MLNGKNAISKWVLNGQTINAPKEWQTAEVLATFDNDAIQASMSIDKFTFVNEEANALLQHITNGMTGGVGIFEGLPFIVELQNKNYQKVIFNGIVDLSEGLEVNDFNYNVSVKLKLRDDLLSLEEKLQALSFGYLESLNLFNNSIYTDVKYVVEKKLSIIEVLISSIGIFIMTKELIETITKLVEQVGEFVSMLAIIPSGGLGAIVWALVVIILNILYATLILIAILKMSNILISQLIPIIRTGKALKLFTALTIVCSHLGYAFQTNIADMSSCYYLPSNFTYDETTAQGIISNWKGNKKGIPSSSDYGYNCAEMFELCKKLFNGKFAILNNTVCFYNVDDLFWQQQSTYQMPDVRNKIKTFNSEELKANRYITFDVDITDDWTIDNYQGTSYEVICKPQVVNDNKLVNIKGLDEIRLNTCLASRKDVPSGFENFLHVLASTIDNITHLFSGNSHFESMIHDSVGLMKISTNNWSKPKIIKLNSINRLVDRSNWSAKYIYDNYYLGKSFVATVNGMTNYGQKEIYNNVRIPFGLDDLITLCNNSYFTLPDGSKGKVISCKYRFSSDTATVDYYIRKPYTSNLTEIYVEPSNQ